MEPDAEEQAWEKWSDDPNQTYHAVEHTWRPVFLAGYRAGVAASRSEAKVLKLADRLSKPVNDNGYDYCPWRHCLGWTHRGEEISHSKDCPVPAYLAARGRTDGT